MTELEILNSRIAAGVFENEILRDRLARSEAENATLRAQLANAQAEADDARWTEYEAAEAIEGAARAAADADKRRRAAERDATSPVRAAERFCGAGCPVCGGVYGCEAQDGKEAA